MASLEMSPAAAPLTATSSERRLLAEWDLLRGMLEANAGRLSDASLSDGTMQVRLQATPARMLPGAGLIQTSHELRIEFPRFFPAMPLELYLDEAVFHPNVHPHTGFVCLWETHRISNTVEHALHKTAAMLGWRLLNLDPAQVMQADAASLGHAAREQLAWQLAAPPLAGIEPSAGDLASLDRPRRRRLS